MVEKRIVTKNKIGEVVKIVEHHDLNAERRAYLGYGVSIGVVVTVLIFALALARFRF